MTISRMYAHAILGGASLAALVAVTPPAYAQAETGMPTAQELDDTGQLEDIVVTARRRSENLQQAPVSVTAFSATALEQRGLDSVKALQNSIPNVSLNDSSGSSVASNLVIRGISSNTRNAGFESGASVYVDGVYTGRPSTFNQAFLDLARIEVLRGPQGTVFGKNSIAGVINITTQRPTTEAVTGFANMTLGNRSQFNASGAVNVPISDNVAFRVAGFRNRRDGYVINLANGNNYLNESSQGGRARLLLEPTEDLTIIFSADYLDENRRQSYPETLSGAIPVVPPPKPIVAPGPRTVFIDIEPFEKRRIHGYSMSLDYALAGGTLTSITAYRSTRTRLVNDNDNSTIRYASIDWFDQQKQFTQEVRFTSPADRPFEYVAGLYYFNQKADTRHTGILGEDFSIPIFANGQFLFFLVAPGSKKNIVPQGRITTDSYAAFVDTTYHLTDSLSLLAGVRYTYEKKRIDFGVDVDPAARGAFYQIANQQDSQKSDNFSPTLGLRYSFGANNSAYAKVTRGFKSGGWNSDFITVSQGLPAPAVSTLQFGSETVTNYEIGLKTEFFDRKLRVNLAAFHLDYKDLQVSQFFGFQGGTITTNAGSARIDGVEAEIQARPTDFLDLNAGVGYTDAKYKTFRNVNPAGDNADGKRLENAPKWTANFGAQVTIPVTDVGSVRLRGDYLYRGSYFTNPLNAPALKVPSYSLVNARIAFADSSERWEIGAYVDNVFDVTNVTGALDDFFAFPGTQETLVGYGPPRSYGLDLKLKF